MTKISNQYSLTNILTADLANSRLGINNVSPTVALDVTGAGKFSGALTVTGGIIASAANGNIRIKGSTDGFLGAGESDNKLYLTDWTTAAKGLTILLTTGAATFSSSVTATGGLRTTAANGYQDTDGTRTIGVFANVTGGLPGVTTISNHDLGLFTNNTERMRITSAGNVGIGTSSPTNLLQVNGTGYFSGALSSGGTISGNNVSSSGTVSGATIIANGAIYTYNVQQYYYGNCFAFTPPNMLNSGSFNSEMRIYLVWIIGVNGYTEAGLRVWLVAVNGGGTAYNANELLGRDANGGTGLSISRSSANQLQICSNNNAFIKFVSVMQLNAF